MGYYETMNLLLTSAGIRNGSILGALKEMLGKPCDEANLCFIPTASLAEAGNHDWFIEDLNRIYNVGWKQFDVLDLNSLPKSMIIERLQVADVIYVEGGNTYALAKAITDNNLAEDFLHLLETKVYVGVSAGSMIFSKDLTKRMVAWYGEDEALYKANDRQQLSPLNYFDWFFKPHVDFTTWKTQDMGFPYYAVDDQTALKIIDGKIEVVSEGKWELVK